MWLVFISDTRSIQEVSKATMNTEILSLLHHIAGYKSALTAIAWPYRGKPGKISVFRDSPGLDAWVRAQITFRKLDNYFLVMFRAGGPAFQEDMLYIALDDVKVVEGVCKEG